jgi:hypothetical protein
MKVTYSMGDGHSVTCNGPGVAYNPALSYDAQSTYCSYTYAASSADQPHEAYTVTATVTYGATWTATGAPGGGSLGTVAATASMPMTVGQIQTLEQS